MHRNRRPTASALRAHQRRHIRFAFSLLLLGTLAFLADADAASGLCANGQCLAEPTSTSIDPDERLLDFAAAHRLTGADAGLSRRAALSSQEFYSFSGVGAVVCTVNGEQRMSTAFLVGAFDIGVTVAHTFANEDGIVAPQDCIYSTTDSLGQIRERIPVAYIRSQWATEAGAAGHMSKDFAVIRLSRPSDYAQRTMPMGKFSGTATSVLMIGFRRDMESDPLKKKGRGNVYEHGIAGSPLMNLEGFAHDIDASGIAAGAPVIDERTGVIIGIHTLSSEPGMGGVRNTMITMNEWLEQTLRAVMQVDDEKGASSL